MPFLVKAWWVLLVFLFHVFGYAVFRVWIAVRRRGSSAEPSATARLPRTPVQARDLERQLERQQVLLAAGRAP